MHICIISQNHLCRNPRVLKEAVVWAELGHKVTIGTLWYDSELLKLDLDLIKEAGIQNETTYTSYTDIRDKRIKGLYDRIEFQLARNLKKYFGKETLQLGGYGSMRIIPWLTNIKPDFVSCHQEIACLVTPKIQLQNIKFSVDFEDWYSKDLLPEDQKLRPINRLIEAERFALQHASFTLTPSSQMTDAMYQKYGGKKPYTIYNSFSEKLRKGVVENKLIHIKNGTLRVAWLSQWIGHGRGLEKMIRYFHDLNIPVEIHLAGNIKEEYEKSLSQFSTHYSKITIYYHPILHPKEIVNWLSKYDAGLACEPTTSYSTDLTVSNKMFYYMLAGIPIIGFYTQGQEEIAKLAPNAIILCDKNPNAASIIKSWLNDKKKYSEAKDESYALGTLMSWENQSIKLKNIIQEILTAD